MRVYVQPVRGWDEPVERGYAHDIEGCQVIEHGGSPGGAFQVKRWPDEFHLARLQIEPRFQGRGWGTRVTRYVQDEVASRHRLPLSLQVLADNPARRLYERLGFEVIARDGAQVRMRWQPGTPA
jgi:ribosomal protein S18 acetylase RimI-like enzyme